MTLDTNHTMSNPAPGTPRQPARRPDLSNRMLRIWVLALCLAITGFLFLKSGLPVDWQRPGSPVLQSLAALGGLLLLVPFLFSIGKRSGYSEIPNRLFILHVGASLLGMFLIGLHAAAAFSGPPLVMAAALVLLLVTGVFARIVMAPKMAATFGTKPRAFQQADPVLKGRLQDLITRKTELLKRLDPAADEGLFSVTLRHLLTRPLNSIAYMRLAREETRLMGTRNTVPPLQAWWRPLHIALAWLFLGGLILHVVLVTFFAGYVADGRDIYWWHLAAW
ncbi:MAG: hypothetical protein RIB80_04430 [Rhodospirillales bacterium]